MSNKSISHDEKTSSENTININKEQKIEDLIFYTDEELNEIQNKIRFFMSEKTTPITIDKCDDYLTRNCKITALFANDAREKNFDDKIVNAYVEYPPFMFYTDPSNSSIRRIYGFVITDDNEIRAHSVSAMTMINNDVLGGVSLNDCVRLKQWSAAHLDKLNSGLVRGADAFLKTDGYMHFIM